MGEKACSACRAWGAAGLLQGMAGLRLAWTHCGLAKPPTSGRAGTGAGRAVGRRPVLAAGGAFDSKHQTRQVSPVSQPDLEAGSQPALYPIAPAHPLNPSVPSLAKTNPPPHLALKVPIPALPCEERFVLFPGTSSCCISSPVPGARVVALAMPHSSAPAACLPWGPKC